jgi:hypothetical protein
MLLMLCVLLAGHRRMTRARGDVRRPLVRRIEAFTVSISEESLHRGHPGAGKWKDPMRNEN